MSSDIRAALERLIELDDTVPHNRPGWIQEWTDAIAAARAALAAKPVGERPSPDYARVPQIATKGEIRAAALYLIKKKHLDGDLIPAIEYAIARWGRPAAPPAPEQGEVGEQHVSRPYKLPEPGEVGEIADHILAELQGFHPRQSVFGELTVDRLTRAATLLQQLSAPAPVAVPVAVKDALIKAECALSDVAEGEPECDEGDPAQWAEQRCAETLAVIRPAMKQHKIRTSEWPPQPLPQAGEGEGLNA